MRNLRQLYLRSVGDVYLPERFAGATVGNAQLRLFGPEELSQLSKIYSHLRSGGIAVTSGQWDRILEIFSYLEKRRGLSAPVAAKTGRRGSRAKRSYGRRYQRMLSHVMVVAHNDRLPYVAPPIYIPYLLQFLGDPPGSDAGLPFLVPVSAIQKIRSDMARFYHISALDGDMMAHSNVLPPKQGTVKLFLEALQKVEQTASLFRKAKGYISLEMEVLDMGCGCGCLSLLAARTFADYDVRVVATDILPEAIATTKLNVRRFIELMKLPSGVVETTDSGDLFEPVGDRRFDLIIFNAPWMVSRPQSRAEIATSDADQNTIRRFLIESPRHLKEQGRIILGYSDHSGPKALGNLEEIIGRAGLKTGSILKRRIQPRRQKRNWQRLLVYDLSV